MASYVQDDCTFDYTPSADVVVGQVVLLADTVTVASRPIASGVMGAVSVEGVFSLPKASGAITQGAIVYWDASAGNVTTTSSGNKRAGKAAAAAVSGDTTVSVALNLG